MKEKIKVAFADFWPRFNPVDNYFWHLLNTKYDPYLDYADPDILFFSVDYARRRQREVFYEKDCLKVFFTGENVRPNFGDYSIESDGYSIGPCDISLSFDYDEFMGSEVKRNHRLPLWAFYTNWFNLGYSENRDPAWLVSTTTFDEWFRKKVGDVGPKDLKFCNFLFSNPSGERVEILKTLQQYKHVHCPGRLCNNHVPIGGHGDQVHKVEFINKYKFTIAAENSQYPGYTTEKMIHPLSEFSIPIYWGSPRVTEEFNHNAFVNANELQDDALLERVLEIDNDDELFKHMISQPIFATDNGLPPDSVMPNSVLAFIEDNL